METPRMQDSELAILDDEVLVVLGKGPDDDDDEDSRFLEDGGDFELDEFDSLDDFDDFDDDDDDDYV